MGMILFATKASFQLKKEGNTEYLFAGSDKEPPVGLVMPKRSYAKQRFLFASDSCLFPIQQNINAVFFVG